MLESLYPFTDKSSCEIQKREIDIGPGEKQIGFRNWARRQEADQVAATFIDFAVMKHLRGKRSHKKHVHVGS